MVGRGGKDHLINTAGNAVMIGGFGQDILEGGRGEVLMIASATSYDGSLNALNGILSQWTNTRLSISKRMEVLSSGFWAGREFVRLDAQTVNEDETNLDSLFGNAGTEWFWSVQEPTEKLA